MKQLGELKPWKQCMMEVIQSIYSVGADRLLPENIPSETIYELVQDEDYGKEVARLLNIPEQEIIERLTKEYQKRFADEAPLSTMN